MINLKKIIAILVPTNGLKKLNLKILNRFKNLKYIIHLQQDLHMSMLNTLKKVKLRL